MIYAVSFIVGALIGLAWILLAFARAMTSAMQLLIGMAEESNKIAHDRFMILSELSSETPEADRLKRLSDAELIQEAYETRKPPPWDGT